MTRKRYDQRNEVLDTNGKPTLNTQHSSPIPAIKLLRKCKKPSDFDVPAIEYEEADESAQKLKKSDHLWQVVVNNVRKISLPKDQKNEESQIEKEDLAMWTMVDKFYNKIENENNILKAYTFGVPIKNHGFDGQFKRKV